MKKFNKSFYWIIIIFIDGNILIQVRKKGQYLDDMALMALYVV